MLLPSAIQRSDDLVGMVTPISAPVLSPPPSLSTSFVLSPHAASATVSATAAAAVAIRVSFIRTPEMAQGREW